MNYLNLIKYMITPSVMISACGLLLLGINNKYSLVVNRIRLLHQELRNKNIENARKEIIIRQIPLLMDRMRLIKNAVWLYTISVIFFILTIIFIGFELVMDFDLSVFVISLFVIGVIGLLSGAIFSAEETRLGYKIVRDIEVGAIKNWI
jgi:uncharacterized membrane protein